MTSVDHLTKDKEFGYSNSHDPPPPLFDLDQWLNNDSLDYQLDCTGPEPHQDADFTIDFDGDTTTSESHSAHSNPVSNHSSEPHFDPPQVQPIVERTAALRQARTFARSEHSYPSISLNELLTLEGKSQTVPRTHPSTSGPGTKTLRRKSKIRSTSELERSASHRVSKTKSNDKMQSSFYLKQETPVHPDWTQRFEQMDLQQQDGQHLNRDIRMTDSPPLGVGRELHSQFSQSPLASAGLPLRDDNNDVRRRRSRQQTLTQASYQSQSQLHAYSPQTPSSPAHVLRETFPLPQINQNPRLSQPSNGLPWTNESTSIAEEDYTVTPSALHSQAWQTSAAENESSYFAIAHQHRAPDTPIPELQSGFAYTSFPSYYYQEVTPHLMSSSPPYPGTPVTPHTLQSHQPSGGTYHFSPFASGSRPSSIQMPRTPHTPTPTSLAATPPPTPLSPPPARRRPRLLMTGFHKSSPQLKSPTRGSTQLSTPRSASMLKLRPSASALKQPSDLTSPTRVSNHRASKSVSTSSSHSRTRSSTAAIASCRQSVQPSLPSNHTQPSHAPQRSRSSRTLSTSAHHPSHNSTAHLPASGGGDFDIFKNFTPDDGEVIRNGVAPSGSNKTKAKKEMAAREEKLRLQELKEREVREEREKQRRLSEAATRFVLERGGGEEDLEMLGLRGLGGTE